MIFLKENKNIDFLNTIYKTSEMGIVGINDVIDKAKKEEFRDFLSSQRKEYENTIKEATKLFASFGLEEKELNNLVKINSKIMSEMKLLKDNSDNMIAKMLMEGTNKGIIKINKAQNENDNIDEEVLKLAQKLLNIMENNLDQLKIYL